MASPGYSPAESKNKRSLSPHVVTRMYRPPEVLLKCAYDTKIDVWSAGTCMVELFNNLFSTLEARDCCPFRSTFCKLLSPLVGEKEDYDVD
mmetsp:Transcript_29788/g.45415  ORF Transcript_29788/g.45415 Transcript_29788/m.45415 type:complete len:91 (-) Transcript_29788:393-665(-)|eukprot:CAMPEP_0170506650 /NCGR_PEP_ID=MMETSP0208-20121228/55732_1 /TAXON_ID=197538 /ORGANISM="Strombidium inclinatum, Strain S3" /LENGTH=90 /DNA_ID=CAMNT_0010788321 /DNA_START=578 /DNA_END=850 /DNA_ORIENTATION=+